MATLSPSSASGEPATNQLSSSAIPQPGSSSREKLIAQHVPSASAYEAATATAQSAPLEVKAYRAGPNQLPDGRLFWATKTRMVPRRLPLEYLRTKADEGATAFKRAVLDEIRKMKEEQYRPCLQDSTDWETTPRAKHEDVIVFHKEFVVEMGSIEQIVLNGREASFRYNFGVLTEEDQEFFADFFNLRCLKMLYCGLTSFENIPRFQFLRELDLTGNQITNFKGLLCFRYLRVVKLCDNRVTTLKHFPFSPGLEDLDLSRNPFNGSLERLVERANHLRILRLRMTPISDPEHLLPLMPKLELIDLGNTPIVYNTPSFARLAPLQSKIIF
ncbi:leucine rich repeat-containing protein [Besnoitia besnoiti]|uniref:Leucine rich repeat-containing protein n=1 Tax=Besnoitia besnoiti TaxID=94643 RepID=A0A2A9MK91_BESBE|nr:leucine rich repeat-containing protein [Besnoitia besnoiti]PFH36027.1 leucine rich repeat-containing protein [Besnoitia besnoiti]